MNIKTFEEFNNGKLYALISIFDCDLGNVMCVGSFDECVNALHYDPRSKYTEVDNFVSNVFDACDPGDLLCGICDITDYPDSTKNELISCLDKDCSDSSLLFELLDSTNLKDQMFNGETVLGEMLEYFGEDPNTDQNDIEDVLSKYKNKFNEFFLEKTKEKLGI